MTERKIKRVITRGGRSARLPARFSFTREMIPSQNGTGSSFVNEYRSHAWDIMNSTGIPDTSMEAWRRTNLRKLQAGSFRLPDDGEYKNLPEVPAELLAPLVGDRHGGQIVLRPGGVDVELDPTLKNAGVVFTDYATAEREFPEILQKVLGKIVQADEGKFSAMVAAYASLGVLLYVPKNLQVELPLHSVHWSPGVGLAHLSHLMIYIEENASVTFVHEAASPTEESGQSLNGGIIEGYVGRGSNFRFVELQSVGRHVWNFSHERVRVDQDASVDWIFGAIGSHLTKNFSDLDLVGRGALGRMSGFYFTDQDQHLDHDTQQNHMAPDTTSDLLFKGALRDNSRSVWQGMIYVAPGAQKTDGYQANRNLVLDPSARADSIPGLEILADDVRCTHGATVGKIDSDMVFYLETRGIPKEVAERLVVEGFFDPIMQRIPYDGVRDRFARAIHEKLL